MTRIATTVDELREGITRKTGQAYELVVPRRVVLDLSWDETLIDALPEDAVLRLRSKERGVQERPLREATRRDGEVQVTFSWRGDALVTSLELASGGKTLTLWKDRAVAKEPPDPWELDLSAWLDESVDQGNGSDEVTASLPEVEGPADERIA